jgi:hypothetical protein
MTQQDNFKKHFWISMSVILFTIAASSVALYFLSVNLEQTANAIGAARAATANGNAEFQDLANLQHDAATATAYQAVMDKLLVSQEALITFPTQIDALGRSNSVSTDFSFQGAAIPSSGSSPGSAAFSLDVSGTLDNVISFMKSFESTSPILLSSLNALNLTANGSNYTLITQGTVFFK